MPRRPRVVLPGVPHHVTQRGNNRQDIFHASADRRLYLKFLDENAARHGLRILAWCLMTNHVHLVVIPDTAESLAQGLGQAHYQYARAFNKDAARVGHLWQNRFYSCLLEGSHLLRAIRYVELNPVRAGLVASPCVWPWSSATAHVQPGTADPLLGLEWPEWFRGWDHAGWNEWLDTGAPALEAEAIRRATSAGEPLGSAAFLDNLERQTGRPLRVGQRGRPRIISPVPFFT